MSFGLHHVLRYRKKKNPERNPVDDRTGSYEVIGRLMFKTCHSEPPAGNQNVDKINRGPDLHNATVATIYSLFNITHNFNRRLSLSTSDGEQKLQKYLARKRILEDLAKSSKSFPSRPKRYVEDRRKFKFEEGIEEALPSKNNVTSCEVEVLYFYGNKCNKSVQFSQAPNSKISLKKWLYHLLPCVVMEDSQTLLPNEY